MADRKIPKVRRFEYFYDNMRFLFILPVLFLWTCNDPATSLPATEHTEIPKTPTLVILGTLQDGGSPHIGCKKKCCEKLFEAPDKNRKVVCLGIVDPANRLNFLVEASPDMTSQLKLLKKLSPFKHEETPNGILVTHAHIGHYAGLMYLGREAMGAKEVPVYAMPRMKSFIETNGPWSQLIGLKNIALRSIKEGERFWLSSNLQVEALRVPHRDEFSETVGFLIKGPNKKVLFIPDIDKWEKWDKKIEEEIKAVDYAFIDATFFSVEELGNRNISEIPHPLVTESMQRLKGLDSLQRAKIHFIHFNHTNPLLDDQSEQTATVKKAGFNLARSGQLFSL